LRDVLSGEGGDVHDGWRTGLELFEMSEREMLP
jgi:hypothetical protein